MKYLYPCNLIPDVEEGRGFVVAFPDVPEAITGAYTREESLFLAEDALAVALTFYVDNDDDIPIPSQPVEGQELIALRPVAAAKLALYSAMREQGISHADLAEKLGISEKAVGNLVEPIYGSHMTSVMNALKAVGRTLVVEDRAV